MPSITFYHRPSSRINAADGRLYIRLIHNRKVKVVASPYKLYREEWDAVNQRLIFPLHDIKRVRFLDGVEDYINRTRTTFNHVIATMGKQGTYCVNDIILSLQIQTDQSNFINYVNKLSRNLIRAGQERTANAYLTVMRGLITFNKGKDMPLADINSSRIKSFEQELKARGKAPNTISFYMRNLRAIYNKAIADKIIMAKTENPFHNVYTGFHKTHKRALSIEELSKFYNLDFSLKLKKGDPKTFCLRDANLYCAWRLFFFCFHARGLCFVDLAYMRKDNIRNGIIRYYRKKTGQQVEIKITPVMQNLIDSFKQEVLYSDYLFPIITDKQKSARRQYETALRIQNRRLKQLAKIAGLNKNISTHVSRHSWATIAKHEHLPLSVISESLGHSNEKTTYTYLASFERTLLDNANAIISAAVERAAANYAYSG